MYSLTHPTVRQGKIVKDTYWGSRSTFIEAKIELHFTAGDAVGRGGPTARQTLAVTRYARLGSVVGEVVLEARSNAVVSLLVIDAFDTDAG